MSDYDLPLIIITVMWVVVVWRWLIPTLSLPIAKIKREFVLFLTVLGSTGIAIEWVTQHNLRIVSIVSLGTFLTISVVMAWLLRRLDYYVEEVLQELFVLAVTSAGIGMVSSVWYWGVASSFSLFALRAVVAGIPILLFVCSWLITKQHHSLWSGGVYIALIAVKWLAFPYWGIWTIVLLLLYSTLVGYVANWMITTTYAEKVLSWNIAPAKVWGLLVLTSGALVILF